MNRNPICLSFDVDWAEDWMIDQVAERLIEKRIKTTWFVTHDSPAVRRLESFPELFEIGIHPNYLPGSTHGDSIEACTEYLLDRFPQAVSLRSHGLYQSGRLLHYLMTRTSILIDSNLFLPECDSCQPFFFETAEGRIWRVPICWADDYQVYSSKPLFDPLSRMKIRGPKVFLFHPIHVVFNSSSASHYEGLKGTKEQGPPHSGEGVARALDRLLDAFDATSFSWIKDTYQMEFREEDALLQSLRSLKARLDDESWNRFGRLNPFMENVSADWKGKARRLGAENVTIYDSATVLGDVQIGANSWIGPFCSLDGTAGIRIGAYCSLSAGVQVLTHDSVRWALSGGKASYEYESTEIGDHCFIGSHAVITKGVRIGDHCVVGANAVVTRDIPPYSVAMGVPARVVGQVKMEGEEIYFDWKNPAQTVPLSCT